MNIKFKKIIAASSMLAMSAISLTNIAQVQKTNAAAWNGQELPYEPIGRTNYDFSTEYVRAAGTNAGSIDSVDKSTLILSTPDQMQHTAFWSKTQLDLTKEFNLKYDWYLGRSKTKNMTANAPTGLGGAAAGPADGTAFVLQADPRGTNAVGSNGAGFGYDTIKNAVVAEWDAYNDDWIHNEIGRGESWNHFAFVKTNSYKQAQYGNAKLSAHLQKTNFSDLGIKQNGSESYSRIADDSRWQKIEVSWKPINADLGYYTVVTNGVSKTQIVSIKDDFGGNTKATYGFTGGTGRDVSMQAVRINKIIPDPYDKIETVKEVSQGQATTVNVGDTVKYTLKVKNNSLKFATEKTLTDPLDKRFEYVSSTQGGVYDALSHKVKWNIPELKPGQEHIIEITLKVKSKN